MPRSSPACRRWRFQGRHRRQTERRPAVLLRELCLPLTHCLTTPPCGRELARDSGGSIRNPFQTDPNREQAPSHGGSAVDWRSAFISDFSLPLPLPLPLPLILILGRALTDTANRDLGAGRVQAARSGLSGRDAARAPLGQGCPFGACPRSVAGVGNPDEVRAQLEANPLVTWGIK